MLLPAVEVAWLGRTAYLSAWRQQEELRRRIITGQSVERILLVEHDPVITLGRNADPSHVLIDPRGLLERGITCVTTNRGGDVTYHGPGQLVAYPVVRLERGVVAHVAALAQAVVDVVAPLGVVAEFRRAPIGVWVGDAKLAAIGIHVSRHVAVHGLALNVTTPLEMFQTIVPCGLSSRVTSLAELVASPPSVEALALPLGAAIAARLGKSAVGMRSSLLSEIASVE